MDFAILIFGRYQQARNEGAAHVPAIHEAVANLGRAVFFGAFTTAVGFLALLLAGSAGFTQLGVLIAIGILVAALFMTSVFFLFTRERSHPPQTRLDPRRRQALRPAHAPRAGFILWLALPILLLLFAVALVTDPAPRLRRQHPLDGAEVERSGLRAQNDHGENAGALGAGHRHRPRA